jgi:hypothetical protein
MIRNMPYSPPNYVVAFVYISAGSVLAWQASRKMAGRGAALCLMTVYAGVMFFLFKHGFVRADQSHMRLFYSCVTPLLALLAMVSFSGLKTKPTSERVELCSASLILFIIYGIMLTFLPGENSPTDLAKNWLTCGNRIVAGVRGQSPEEFPAKRAFIKNSQPRLFYRLNEYGRTFGAQGRKPRITFYPWELMYFEGLEGFVLAPSPSLQLYSSGPRSRAHRMEAAYLSSENRPDIVVIGPASIDNRSPVSELTDLLPPLYSNYRVIDVVDGFILLEAAKEGISLETVVRYSETPQGKPGEFLSISIDQPMAVNSLLWRLAAIIFKSPQLNVVVTILYGNNEKAEYAVRGYLSQLQGGILFSPEGISDFFGSAFRTSAQTQNSQQRNAFTIKSAVAEVRRSPGFWNLPVFPRVVPLKVKFCTFQ